jgi:hypothetical protein
MPFNIGPGVLDAMQANHDEPRTNESYITPDVSQTYGRDALYVYYKEDNAVRRLPFDA